MRGSGFHSWRAASILGSLLLGVLSGCAFLDSSGSFSDSSGSVSDSIGSSSDSSASSSAADEQAYREDVRDLTIAIARLNGPPDSLRRGISELALGRGISDWEAIAGTYAAVGEGLAHGGVTTLQLLAYQTALARPGSANFEAIGAGYEALLP